MCDVGGRVHRPEHALGDPLQTKGKVIFMLFSLRRGRILSRIGLYCTYWLIGSRYDLARGFQELYRSRALAG